MVTKTECGNCHRSSKETEGWWTVSELLRTYALCPRCYRNRSLLAYRETLLEAMQAIDTTDKDYALMQCIAIVRDTKFNE
jgi:hypothetical protein